LSLISKSLIGKAGEADINLVSFVVSEISKRVAIFLEHELLLGTGTDACQGILTGATNVKETSAASTIKSDDLITCKNQFLTDINQTRFGSCTDQQEQQSENSKTATANIS
jgi:HK97 family phage major capsid protein